MKTINKSVQKKEKKKKYHYYLKYFKLIIIKNLMQKWIYKNILKSLTGFNI